MTLTKLYKPSVTALRQLFNHQFLLICVLSSNGEMAANSAVSHGIVIFLGSKVEIWLVVVESCMLESSPKLSK